MKSINSINSISICHGKYIFAQSSGSIYVSAVKSGNIISSGYVRPSTLYKERSIHSCYIPSRVNGRAELGGFNIGKTLDVPDGKLLRLVNNGKRNGRDYINASIIVLVHKDAGMVDIRATLPTDRGSALGTSILVFNGNGVILTDTQINNLGYTMPESFIRRYRNKEELDEGFIIDHITKGSFDIDEVKAVKKANGVITIIAKAKPRKRKILL